MLVYITDCVAYLLGCSSWSAFDETLLRNKHQIGSCKMELKIMGKVFLSEKMRGISLSLHDL